MPTQKAVTALKYFCEEAPEYHIAAAGSLIGISLAKPGAYPVGKVDVKRLYPQQVDDILLNLLDLYQLDFAKHAPPKDFQKISQVWEAIPQQLAKENQRFIFGQVKEGSRGKDLEDALTWLVDAGMVYRFSSAPRENKGAIVDLPLYLVWTVR